MLDGIHWVIVDEKGDSWNGDLDGRWDWVEEGIIVGRGFKEACDVGCIDCKCET